MIPSKIASYKFEVCVKKKTLAEKQKKINHAQLKNRFDCF